MASATGMIAEEIDEMMGEMVISLRVDENGQVIYKRRNGQEFNGGAVKALKATLEKAWPVNSVFISIVPTNPADLIGVGAWVRFAYGRTLVGVSENETEFSSVEKTGGAKEVKLTTSQIPSHTHEMKASYNLDQVDRGGSTAYQRMSAWNFGSSGVDSDRTGNTGSTGGSQPHTNLQPYTTVYIWKRVG